MIFALSLLIGGLLCPVCFVQLLYLESLRLRTREFRSLNFFKEQLEERLGYETEEGAFLFSLVKHTLMVLCGSVFVVVLAAKRSPWQDLGEGLLIGWLVMMIAGYVLPQILYRRTEGRWMLPLVPALHVLGLLFKPLTLLLRFLHSLFELSEPASQRQREPDASEEIEALITAGEEEGIIEKEDSKLIQNVVAFGDKRVREVMTPRRAMVCIDSSASLEDLRRLAKNEQYSRIPVYEGAIDRVVGFVHVRDLYELDDEQRKARTLKDLMRPIEAVPETKPVPELLRDMQRRGIHIVYVVDEYGNVAGLATMEDLVEEVFGEIRDEHEPPHDIERGPDGSITVAGSFDLDHLHEFFGFKPEEEIESTTVGGLATEWCGAVPKAGSVVERDGLRIEVLAADDRRVDKVKISATRGEKTDPEVETA